MAIIESVKSENESFFDIDSSFVVNSTQNNSHNLNKNSSSNSFLDTAKDPKKMHKTFNFNPAGTFFNFRFTTRATAEFVGFDLFAEEPNPQRSLFESERTSAGRFSLSCRQRRFGPGGSARVAFCNEGLRDYRIPTFPRWAIFVLNYEENEAGISSERRCLPS